MDCQAQLIDPMVFKELGHSMDSVYVWALNSIQFHINSLGALSMGMDAGMYAP